MKYALIAFRCLLLLSLMLSAGIYASAQESTEIHGFYQVYRDFSFRTGIAELDIENVKLNGGGFGFAYNLAPWFAMWTQFSFFGTVEQPASAMSVRVINNLQGFRFQTQQFGPLRLYGRAGLGFSNYSMNIQGSGYGDTKFSFGYGGGVQIWLSRSIGLNLDASHVIMGLSNLTDLPDREKWDSGLAFTTGVALRF
jgi:hypothetical protein